MTDIEARKWLRGIVNQRLYLLKTDKNYRNKLLMIHIATRLNAMLNAYAFSDDKIFNLIKREHLDILMIIPANASETKNIETLNGILKCNQTKRKGSLTNTGHPLPTQLQLQLS